MSHIIQLVSIFIKKKPLVVWLTSLIILTTAIIYYHINKKESSYQQTINLINNVYFKKTVLNVFSHINSKFQKIALGLPSGW